MNYTFGGWMYNNYVACVVSRGLAICIYIEFRWCLADVPSKPWHSSNLNCVRPKKLFTPPKSTGNRAAHCNLRTSFFNFKLNFADNLHPLCLQPFVLCTTKTNSPLRAPSNLTETLLALANCAMGKLEALQIWKQIIKCFMLRQASH